MTTKKITIATLVALRCTASARGRFPGPEHCYPLDPETEADIQGARA